MGCENNDPAVRLYVEDTLQADYIDIAERSIHAMNNSKDLTRKENMFYLVHGWDAHSTLKDMMESMRLAAPTNNRWIDSANPVPWRRASNRKRKVDLRLAKEYKVREKARGHNEKLS